MAVKLDQDKPIVDWFSSSVISYVTIKNNNVALPNGDAIAFGKFKVKTDINPYYYDDITEEDLNKFGDYLRTLTETENKK